MDAAELGLRRLAYQGLAQPMTDDPAAVVRRMGAVQSQDYAGAKWALGLRVAETGDAQVEQALTDGRILRTHVMRPTWHFVTPDDIRWMLRLTAPRVKALMGYYNRLLELDNAVFARSNSLIASALEGGRQLTRPELAEVLSRGGIAADNIQRLGHLMMNAELDAVVCSGARRGKQQTYALLDERAPGARMLEPDEALAELALSYFTSHGPATIKDYVWWSGLTSADAKAGLEMVSTQLEEEIIAGQSYWRAASVLSLPPAAPTIHLLPNFDEYTVGYTDRSAIFDRNQLDKLKMRDTSLLDNAIILDGQIIGSWKRTLRKAEVNVSPQLIAPLGEAEDRALTAAIERYAAFLGLAAVRA